MGTLRKMWRRLRPPRRRARPGLWEAIGFDAPPNVRQWSAENVSMASRLLVEEAGRLMTVGALLDAEWVCSLDALERAALQSAAQRIDNRQRVQSAMADTAAEWMGANRAN